MTTPTVGQFTVSPAATMQTVAAQVAQSAISPSEAANVAPAIRQGKVISIDGGTPPTLTITFDGTTNVPGIRYLASYPDPAVDDIVNCVVLNGVTWAMGPLLSTVPVGTLPRMRDATIVSNDGDTCTVNFGAGNVSGIEYSSWYYPVAGHTVQTMSWDNSTWWVTDRREAPVWIDLTLLNSFTNYGGAYPNAGKNGLNGTVHIRGVLIAPSSATGNTIATLTPSYRPAYQMTFLVDAYGGPKRIDVGTNGNIWNPGGLLTASQYFCLNFTYRVG